MKKLYLLLLIALALGGCTKTDDYLKQKFIDHSDLIDPESSIFRNVTYEEKENQEWCGEINAKNKLGGYTGWVPFKVIVRENEKISASILQLEEIPVNATKNLKISIEDLNKSLINLHNLTCKDFEPASDWVFFWKK